MRWIQMIFSFIMKRVTAAGDNPHPMEKLKEELKEFFKENAIKLFVGMVMIVTLGTLLTAGIYMLVASLTAQADLGLSPSMTAMAWGGLLMALVPAALLGFAWYKSTPLEKTHKHKKKKHEQEQIATLEQAAILLVTDFIEERQMKRAFKFERERRLAEAEMIAAERSAGTTESYQRH